MTAMKQYSLSSSGFTFVSWTLKVVDQLVRGHADAGVGRVPDALLVIAVLADPADLVKDKAGGVEALSRAPWANISQKGASVEMRMHLSDSGLLLSRPMILGSCDRHSLTMTLVEVPTDFLVKGAKA